MGPRAFRRGTVPHLAGGVTDVCPVCSQPLTVYRAVADGWTFRCDPCDIYLHATDTEMMTTYRFVLVRRYARGARWPSGDPRMCDRCGINQRLNGGHRRRQATFTATLVEAGSLHRLPVAYCPEHEPEATV